MAENIDYLYIGGRIKSTASDEIAIESVDILDTETNTTQSEVNSSLQGQITGLQEQNFVTLTASISDTTLADVFTGITIAKNTIYRIANWKGDDNTTFYNTSYYSEYSANGTATTDLVLLTVTNKGIDNGPTAGSNNLVKSGGVQNRIVLAVGGDIKGTTKIDFSKVISSNGKWDNSTSSNYAKLIDISGYQGGTLKVTTNGINNAIIAFLTSDVTSKQYPEYAQGETNRRVVLISSGSETFDIPSDCVYLYVVVFNNNADATPSLEVNANIIKEKTETENLSREFNLIKEWTAGVYSATADSVGNATGTNTGTRYYTIIQNIPIGSVLCYNVPEGYFISIRESERTYPEPASSGWLNGIGKYTTQNYTTIYVLVAKGSTKTSSITKEEAEKVVVRLENSEIQKNTDRILSLSEQQIIKDAVENLNKSTADWAIGNVNNDGSYSSDNTRLHTTILNITGGFIYYDLPKYLRLVFSEREEDGTVINSSGFVYDKGYYTLTHKKYTYAVLSYVDNRLISAADSELIRNLVSVSEPVKEEIYSELLASGDNIELIQKGVEQFNGKFSVNGGLQDPGSNVNPRLVGMIRTTGTTRVNNGGFPISLPIGSLIEFEFNDGYKIAINEYDGSSTSNAFATGWIQYVKKGSYYVKNGTEIYISAGKVTDGAITLEEFYANVKFTIKSGLGLKVSKLELESNLVLPLVWEQGTIKDDFAVQSTGARICSRLYSFPIGTKILYDIPVGYKVAISEKANASASMIGSGWLFRKGEYSTTEGGYVGFVCAKEPNTVISPSEGKNIFLAIDSEISQLSYDVNSLIKDKAYADVKYSYEGERLNVNTFFVKNYMQIQGWQNMQGGALFGDYLVCCMAMDELDNPSANGFIYNIKTGEKVSDLLFDSTLDGVTYEIPHANQVSFGTEYYDENSDFPLLYVSQVNGGSAALWAASERGVLVYNLEKTEENDTISYTPVLVQAIIPDLTDTGLMTKLGKYTPNYVIDTDKNQIVVLGYPNETWFDLNGPQPIAIFNVPDLSEGARVVLTDSDVVDSYTLPVSKGLQQSFYRNGKIYISGGVAGQGDIRVLDLVKKEVITNVALKQFTNREPQFIGVYNGKFLYYEAGTSGLIYELVF